MVTHGQEYCGERCRDAEATTWKSRVNATTLHVHSPFKGMSLAVPLTWTPDHKQDLAVRGLSECDAIREAACDCAPPQENGL